MSIISIGLNILLAVLLGAALFMGWRLNNRLNVLRDSQEGFARAVGELNAAAQRAERGLAELRAASDEASEVLLRALAEGLSLLRGVDTGEADAVLDLVGVEHGQGVAVGDADDAAFEEIGGGGRGGEKQEEQAQRKRPTLQKSRREHGEAPNPPQ